MENFIKARLIKSDLIEILVQFERYNLKDMSSIILLKQALISIANLVDFESNCFSRGILKRDWMDAKSWHTMLNCARFLMKSKLTVTSGRRLRAKHAVACWTAKQTISKYS